VPQGPEGEGIKYEPFNGNSPEKDVTNYLDQARQDIILAHGVPSPKILGLPGAASLGGDGGTIEAASKEFYNQSIKPVQTLITDTLGWLFSKAGYIGNLVIVNSFPGANVSGVSPQDTPLAVYGATGPQVLADYAAKVAAGTLPLDLAVRQVAYFFGMNEAEVKKYLVSGLQPNTI
jgi:hypothetical protein